MATHTSRRSQATHAGRLPTQPKSRPRIGFPFSMKKKHFLFPAGAALLSPAAFATPETYTIDPAHTYPSFEAPHIQGISIWRGKINKTSGTIVLDLAARTGSVDIVMDVDSIDFGMDMMNARAKSEILFDVAKYPTISYKSDSIRFEGGVPAAIDGNLTMHGVTRQVPLKINSFKCVQHPMLKREVCGADASATLDRTDFGISYQAQSTGSWVRLQIQVEAMKGELPPMGPPPGAAPQGAPARNPQ